MKRNWLNMFVVLFTISAVGLSCGGSSSDTDDDGNGDGTFAGTTVGDTVVVDDLSTLPELEMSALNSAVEENLSKSVYKENSGEQSDGGCMAINYFGPMTIANLEMLNAYNCYIAATQAGTEADDDADNDMVIPNDEYAYYQIKANSGMGPDGDMDIYIRVRVGNFATDDVNTFQMGACEAMVVTGETPGDADFKHAHEVRITGNIADKTWDGEGYVHMTLRDPITEGESEIRNVFGKVHFDILMNSEEALGEEFAFENVVSAETEGYLGKEPDPISDVNDVTDETSFYDVFQLGYDYDSETELNTTFGSFLNEGNEARGRLYAKFNTTNGVAYLESERDGTTDGNLDSDQPEAFNPADATLADDAGDITIDASEVPDYVTEELVRTQIAFPEEWDCTGTFNEIDGTEYDYAECDEMANGFNEMLMTAGENSCFGGPPEGDGGNEGGDGSDIMDECIGGEYCNALCEGLIAHMPEYGYTQGECESHCNDYETRAEFCASEYACGDAPGDCVAQCSEECAE